MRFARLRGHPGTGSGPLYTRLEGQTAHALDGPPWSGGRETGVTHAWTEADLLCPALPSKLVCVGRNYAAHARELGNEPPPEPLLFLKPPSALLDPGGTVLLPPDSARVEHEAELAVVIGRRAKNVARESALAHVFGYTCACDVTARDLQRKDVQFTRAKSFDTFAPLGPWIETELDPGASPHLRVVCRVNGQVRQNGTTENMIFDVPTIVAFASRAMTLEPGDVILTGTPEGVGPLVAGDALEVEIAGNGRNGAVGSIGTLKLRVGI
jgi:2-keto-4-pentenoate hydratase/2-oxohepta-3-ene-1,7-dioic acid hydratase in catechol pathway